MKRNRSSIFLAYNILRRWILTTRRLASMVGLWAVGVLATRRWFRFAVGVDQWLRQLCRWVVLVSQLKSTVTSLILCDLKLFRLSVFTVRKATQGRLRRCHEGVSKTGDGLQQVYCNALFHKFLGGLKFDRTTLCPTSEISIEFVICFFSLFFSLIASLQLQPRTMLRVMMTQKAKSRRIPKSWCHLKWSSTTVKQVIFLKCKIF